MKCSSVFCLLSATSLFANPENPTVVSGDVSFDTSGSLLTVSSEDFRSIVEWEGFSIGSSETTHFSLSNASSAILNRVTTSNVSNILGSLTSNGQVYVINPNGIYIHDGAVVSTAAFLASTMDTGNQEFLDGEGMTFTTTDNSDVVLANYGTIEAENGDAVLLGFQVVNQGQMSAESGTAVIGAGLELIYLPNNEPKITIISSSGAATSTGIDCTGTIEAYQAQLKADGNLYQYAINLEGGEIEVGGSSSFVRLESPDGNVYVNTPISSINDSGYSGGLIEVLGTNIQIAGGAVLESAGLYAGGQIYVGGGWQGSDPDRFNAETTLVDGDALLDCSAIVSGDAGLAVVWADDTTAFYGTVDATGGALGGNGGIVEISGVENLYFYGTADVSAPFGDSGSLILDPAHLVYQPAEREGFTQATPIIVE